MVLWEKDTMYVYVDILKLKKKKNIYIYIYIYKYKSVIKKETKKKEQNIYFFY